MKTIHVEISGKVQKVFFRATAKEIAAIHKISGWIKNTKDGNVEALITGEEDALKEFISWCKKGPERAKVHDIIITEMPIQKFNKFEVVR
jgi:acylphosphatase